MTGFEQLTAADPARDRVPTRDEAERMDARMAHLLADEAPAGAEASRLRHGFRDEPDAPALGAGRRVVARCRRAPLGARRTRRRRALRRVRARRDRRRSAPDRARPATAARSSPTSRARSPPPPPQTGRYAYEKRLSYVSHMRPKPGGKGTFVVVLPHEDEQWVADDGTGVVRNVIHEDQPTFPTPEDKADYEAARRRARRSTIRRAAVEDIDGRSACRAAEVRGAARPTRRSCASASRAAT